MISGFLALFVSMTNIFYCQKDEKKTFYYDLSQVSKITSLVMIYSPETGYICPVIRVQIVKFGTDIYGNWFSKYRSTRQLFSLSSYAT